MNQWTSPLTIVVKSLLENLKEETRVKSKKNIELNLIRLDSSMHISQTIDKIFYYSTFYFYKRKIVNP